MINLTIWNNYINYIKFAGGGGRVKQSDVVSGNAYMHIFSSTQLVCVFWLVHLIHLHLR